MRRSSGCCTTPEHDCRRSPVSSWVMWNLSTDLVRYHGKGSKDRRVRFGPKTGRAVSRYLREDMPRHYG